MADIDLNVMGMAELDQLLRSRKLRCQRHQTDDLRVGLSVHEPPHDRHVRINAAIFPLHALVLLIDKRAFQMNAQQRRAVVFLMIDNPAGIFNALDQILDRFRTGGRQETRHPFIRQVLFHFLY